MATGKQIFVQLLQPLEQNTSTYRSRATTTRRHPTNHHIVIGHITEDPEIQQAF